MKKWILLILVSVLILAGCQPVEPAGGTDGDGPVAQPMPDEDDQGITGLGTDADQPDSGQDTPSIDEPGVVIVEEFDPSQQGGGDEEPVPVPPLEWDPDPEVLVVSGTACCGLTTRIVAMTYIPDFQIWGDGRFVWVQYTEGQRSVFERQLQSDEMSELLARIGDYGFFGWQAQYANYSVADLPNQCISVFLIGSEKSTCEYYEGAPAAFHELYDLLSAGAGFEGQSFVPAESYLIGEKIPVLAGETLNQDVEWTTGTVEVPENPELGVSVEGDLLEGLWKAANAAPFGTIVWDGENYFNVGLQVPGVSLGEVPPR
jgi:hypothetical protein